MNQMRGIRGTLAMGVLVLALTSVLVGMVWREARCMGDTGLVTASRVIVRSGDTLWKLAKTHGPVGEDPRRTVDSIRRLNDLESARLQPGMVLYIPSSKG